MDLNRKVTGRLAAVLTLTVTVSGVSYNNYQKQIDDSLAKSESITTAGVSSLLASTDVDAVAFTSGVSAILNDFDQVDVTATSAVTVASGQEDDSTFCGYTNLGLATVEEGNLNIREEASTDSDVVGKMTDHNACEILSEEDGWSKVTSGKVTGYVKSEYLITGDEALEIAKEEVVTYASVKTTTLNVRKKASTDSKILSQVGDGEDLVVTAEEKDGWIEVEVDDEVGYVSAEFVDVAEKLKTAKTITEVRYGEGVSDVKVDLVQYALQFVGNPYVWGGTSLTNGTDCSGFTMSIYAKYGIYLPHSSRSQPSYGTKVSASEAQPGDLFFYGSGKSIGHVAIYIGNGQIVHASNKRDGIKISNAYYRTPICVCRYLQ